MDGSIYLFAQIEDVNDFLELGSTKLVPPRECSKSRLEFALQTWSRKYRHLQKIGSIRNEISNPNASGKMHLRNILEPDRDLAFL